MSEIGSGNNSSYPGDLDTNSIPEVNSPAVGKTKARKEPIEDLTDAVIKIETELGTDPAGSLTDVKTFLQTQHQTDGTHKNTHGPHKWIDEQDYANFTSAVAAAPNKTLVIARSISLDANTVIPASVSIMPINPGVIVSNGYTLTINGPVVGNPMHQWLSGFAAGEVTFGYMTVVYPEWFQVNTTPGVTNMAVAFQTALDSIIAVGGTVIMDTLMGVGSNSWVGLHVSNASNISVVSSNPKAGFKLLYLPSQTIHGYYSSMLLFTSCTNIHCRDFRIDLNNIETSAVTYRLCTNSTKENLYATNSPSLVVNSTQSAFMTSGGIRTKWSGLTTYRVSSSCQFGVSV